MNAAQAEAIGKTVTNLLLHADREGLHLTTWPINVKDRDRGESQIELSACKPNGDDYEVRVIVKDGEVYQVGSTRRWDRDAQQMGDWQHGGIDGVTP